MDACKEVKISGVMLQKWMVRHPEANLGFTTHSLANYSVPLN